MLIEVIPGEFTVAKAPDFSGVCFSDEFVFLSKTDEEFSVVSRAAPENSTHAEGGWRAFRIKGILDFSLVGILADITHVLSENKIALFAVSTYNTDYLLVKREALESALSALSRAGYTIENPG